MKDLNTDIVAPSETWLSSATVSVSFLGDLSPHFEIYRCDHERKRGGGVAPLVRGFIHQCLVFKSLFLLHTNVLYADIAFGNDAVRTVYVYRTSSCSASMTVQMAKAIMRSHATHHALSQVILIFLTLFGKAIFLL